MLSSTSSSLSSSSLSYLLSSSLIVVTTFGDTVSSSYLIIALFRLICENMKMTILWAQHRTPRMIAKQFDRSMWLSVFKSHCFFCWGVGYSNVGVSLPLLNFLLIQPESIRSNFIHSKTIVKSDC